MRGGRERERREGRGVNKDIHMIKPRIKLGSVNNSSQEGVNCRRLFM